MPRVVSLFFPTFPTDRLRKRSRKRSRDRSGEGGGPPESRPSVDPTGPTGPTVTVVREGSRRIVAAADDKARALGLKPGMAVAQAQASVPGLAVVDAAPEADALALAALAGWCLRYSPVVQADPPDGIFIDVEGAAHLLGGEPALLGDLVARLDRSGLAVQAGLAETPGAAWALARHLPGTIVPSGGAEGALAFLPMAALRLAPETCKGLGLLGVERIGQLARFSRAQLTLRFGPDLLKQQDRALGRAPEPLTPLVPPALPQARLAFAEPLTHGDGLAAAVARLTVDLCRELDRRRAGLRRLDALFRRVDGRPFAIRIGTAAPSRDPAHLARLLGERLPEIDPGFGIDEIALAATQVETLRERQIEAGPDLSGEDLPDLADAPALGPLVDKLGVRLGAERVYRAAAVESRVPERSVRRVPALAPPTGGSWPVALPRPSRLIEPPELVTATALLPDNPPIFFVWRRVRYIVRGADGPERVRGEWWRADEEVSSLRDYYRVEDTGGRRFWLFRDAPVADGGRWWLHGRFS